MLPNGLLDPKEMNMGMLGNESTQSDNNVMAVKNMKFSQDRLEQLMRGNKFRALEVSERLHVTSFWAM